MPPKKMPISKSSKKTELIEDSSSDDELTAEQAVHHSDDSENDSDTHVELEPIKKSCSRKPPTVKVCATKTTSRKPTNDEDEQPLYAEQRTDHSQRPPRQNKSVALNFRYEDYYEVDDPINTMSIEEILRHAVARSSKEGKKALMMTLRKTLQAMNSETSFPEFERPPQQQTFGRPQPRGGGGYRQYSNRGGNREQSFQEFE